MLRRRVTAWKQEQVIFAYIRILQTITLPQTCTRCVPSVDNFLACVDKTGCEDLHTGDSLLGMAANVMPESQECSTEGRRKRGGVCLGWKWWVIGQSIFGDWPYKNFQQLCILVARTLAQDLQTQKLAFIYTSCNTERYRKNLQINREHH